MKLTILGNGAGGPFQGRHYTAQVLETGNQMYLIDCGEGTQAQLYHHRIRYDRVKQVFISHLHGDHVFGLVGLLTSLCLKQRETRLQVFSPPGLQELVEHTFRLCGVITPYPLLFEAVDPTVHALVFDNKQVEVWSIPLHHRTPCCGWLFREKIKPRNMRKEAIERYQIPFSDMPNIKAGADWRDASGQSIPNAELTTEPSKPASYAFCSDTAPSEQVAACVQGVDLLYHEATFLREQEAEAHVSFHSTAEQAAHIALKAGVGQLLLGHFSARYRDLAAHLAEAQAVFSNVLVAEEGQVYGVGDGV
jgi:ribonuclease Z